ncbi:MULTISPECIES: hypothetical protein [Bartonella]|nr:MULTISPECIES: hypothetical protein [Bartonella]
MVSEQKRGPYEARYYYSIACFAQGGVVAGFEESYSVEEFKTNEKLYEE